MLLLDSTHHHAEVPSFDDDADALGRDDLLDGLRDLGRETLLNLQASREQFDQAWDFAESDHPAIGNIGYVHLAEEGQKVMLAQAEDFDVFDDDHLVVIHRKERALE